MAPLSRCYSSSIGGGRIHRGQLRRPDSNATFHLAVRVGLPPLGSTNTPARCTTQPGAAPSAHSLTRAERRPSHHLPAGIALPALPDNCRHRLPRRQEKENKESRWERGTHSPAAVTVPHRLPPSQQQLPQNAEHRHTAYSEARPALPCPLLPHAPIAR
ncbi:hypothetical protein NDU88_009730 [Pleurodeles waltl]|uniref:Uncharacterized protein n=1 Tax=Pleurodeles waltl TaxID=8319 RepID=A0AAV7PT11_PLEWA|nr:hypothetical protein NDU88_009730 [Pleurodeles waltl]